jgi:hypothetical protein
MSIMSIILSNLFRASDYIGLFDVVIGFAYIIIIWAIARFIKQRKIEKQAIYKYFLSGLMVKIAAGILFCLVYIFYYHGGDTISYFQGNSALTKLFFHKPIPVFSMLFGNNSGENLSYFTEATGKPWGYIYSDSKTFSVCRFNFIFNVLGWNRFLLNTILLNVAGFIGIWKFFQMLVELYPQHIKKLAIAVLFVPSVVFWSSGILKDSFTYSATLWLIVNIYYVFFKKKKIITNLLLLVINAYIILSIKPYIFIALLPTSLIWLSIDYIRNIRSKSLRVVMWPTIIFLGLFLGNLIFFSLSDNLGAYSSVDSMINKAQISQQDLIRAEQYGENFTNIGAYEASTEGILKKMPTAIFTALFRPFIWESNSVFILLTAVENIILLFLSIYLILFIGIKKMGSALKADTHLVFFLIFSLFFAFAIGISTSNYGAMVRYRIPMIPLFLAFLIIMIETPKSKSKEKKNRVP